ncbi:MAG: PDDEXK nuclease domain-containing protein [Gallionella sp.]|nr:PDDEXK nuclease domain-containing protein [Gallionella sp.]
MTHPTAQNNLLLDIRQLIAHAQQRAAAAVNAELTLLYWQIGKRIQHEVLQGQRAEYGKQMITKLAEQLTTDYGKGWSEKQLRHCLRLAEVFADEVIFSTVRRKLGWSHIKMLLSLDDPLKRDFYIEIAHLEGWSSRQLQNRIQSMLYERTAISKKPKETIQQDLVALRSEGKFSPDFAFRDPYLLDFLGLADTYSEKDLESSILAEMQRFITELGSDFAFMARQKRITLDQRDYYIDLLFYHRRLKCLVAIDLKIGEFEAAYKGQMELYLRYLEKYEQLDGENTPIGLILCTGKNQEHVELLQLDQSNIRVADYLTLLPPKEVLVAKLHRSIEMARQRLGQVDEV